MEINIANCELQRNYLNRQVIKYNQPEFIDYDPIQIPHQFSKLQDIEIAGFFAAIFSWGNRKSILNSCRKLLVNMDNAPFDFVENFTENDLKPFSGFSHRTFNAVDLRFMLYFFKNHYQKFDSLENAFTQFIHSESTEIKELLTGFHQYFFRSDYYPERTKKHIATPERNSACKRLNMFLRWMVRQDKHGVDFGLWKKISPSNLICPLDIHSGRTARQLGLLPRKQNDWKAAELLTAHLRYLNPEDPVIYDYALFGLGVNEK